MTLSINSAVKLAAITMLAVVATQLIYVGADPIGYTFNSKIIWTIEAIAFSGMALGALLVSARSGALQLAAAAIAVGAILNVVQVGMGLAMFGPLREAGEALAPAFSAVLAGAFWFFFAGKALFGLAGILIGLGLWGQSGLTKAIAGLAILTGLAALLVNGAALGVGMDLVFPAGATGTAATLFAALALLRTKADA